MRITLWRICARILAMPLLLPMSLAAQSTANPSGQPGSGISITYKRAAVPVLNPDGGLDSHC